MLLIFCHLVPQLDQMSSAGCQSSSVVLLYVSPEGKCRTVKKKIHLAPILSPDSEFRHLYMPSWNMTQS